MFAALSLAIAVPACGGGADDDPTVAAIANNLIHENPAHEGTRITVGSKNFTEQRILGQIYAQALEAAGYDVTTALNRGSERVLLRALKRGEIDAYPEYTSTALTSFFGLTAEEVPTDPGKAFEESRDDFRKVGLVAYEPTPFSSANAVGLLTETADELNVSTVSDLADKSGHLALAGAPECRKRVDCLLGLELKYGLQFERFIATDVDRRYDVLDSGKTDLSILFTTDPQLFVSDNYAILEDDQGEFPAGNVLFVAGRQTADRAGPDFEQTVENVQRSLTLDVMQELNARVDIARESPAGAARAYLEEFGYVK